MTSENGKTDEKIMKMAKSPRRDFKFDSEIWLQYENINLYLG